jgi:pimeloyl-ACP methyl ester carboxylesterase
MAPVQPPGRIETLNGTQLYFEVHGSGEPVVLLHGFSGSSQDWSSTIAEWRAHFELIVPDMRGHGRSAMLSRSFRHQDAAADILALLDLLNVSACKGLGISGGGNVLLHMASMHPERIKAMVLVSATPYFPAQARTIMHGYRASIPEQQREMLRRRHPGGDAQIEALLASTEAFAASYDDMSFTPPHLATIRARTMIVQGDRDPLYPVELSLEMAKAIPESSLWIVPQAGHGAVIGERWPEFLKTALTFLRGSSTASV